MNERRDLPQGWTEAPLGSFTTIIGGSTPSRGEAAYFGGDIPWLTPTEVPKNTVATITDTKEKLTDLGYKSSSVRLIPAGSVLLTSRASIGYVAIAGIPITTNQGFASFVLPEGFEPRYLAWWLRSQKAELEGRAPGTTFKEISKGTLRELVVPIPPLAEQRRIVAAIEEQFTRLDAGVAALKSARARLKQYRAAVLKAAVEGELTKAWREAHPDIEPASELLARILAERRLQWEAEQRAKGKDPAKERYQEPVPAIITTLFPRTWCAATVEQVSQIVRYGSSAKTSADASGIAVLRMGNIQLGALDLTNLKYLPTDHTEFPDLLLLPGDLLFNRTNSPELVGKSAVYRGTPQPCSYASYLINVRLLEGCSPEYLAYFLNSSYGREWVASVVVQQVGQANVNGTKLQALTFSFPPELEQRQIVEEVERRLSILGALEETVTAGLQRAERLRQSILTEAFAGRLVPQDEKDEPASVLLARIQAESTVPGITLPRRRTKAKPAQLPLSANN